VREGKSISEIESHHAGGSSPQSIPAPLLTIAIPTYNRSRYLRELLDSLRDDLRGETQVELMVSDNCSSDDTPEVIERFKEQGMRIRSIRNTANIGADGNFAQCFALARGKYFWLIGDDDLVAPGAVPFILTKCQSAEWDMIYLSQFPIKEPIGTLERKQPRKVVELTDPREYARRVYVFFTFISANIVNRQKIAAAAHRATSELKGTNLGQLAWTLAALDVFERGLFVHDALVGARDNIAGGYQLFETFGPKLKAIVEKQIRDPKVRRAILNGTLRRFLPIFALLYKRSKIPFRENIAIEDRLTPAFRSYFLYWICLYPILVLPYWMALAWYFPFRCLNRFSTEMRLRLESGR